MERARPEAVPSRLAAPAAANGAVDGALAVPVAQLNDLEARRRHRRAPCLFRELLE